MNALVLKQNIPRINFVDEGDCMKALIFFMLTLAVSMNSFATELGCIQSPYTNTINYHSYSVATDDILELVCYSLFGKTKDEKYFVTFEGVGLGLKYDDVSGMVISCPFVRDSKLVGNYFGIKASASLVGGVTVVHVRNKGLGGCTILGAQLGLGAQVSAGKLIIKHY